MIPMPQAQIEIITQWIVEYFFVVITLFFLTIIGMGFIASMTVTIQEITGRTTLIGEPPAEATEPKPEPKRISLTSCPKCGAPRQSNPCEFCKTGE